jgi:hypothetical protein
MEFGDEENKQSALLGAPMPHTETKNSMTSRRPDGSIRNKMTTYEVPEEEVVA